MILRAIPESERGIKTSSCRNIKPLVETKMPFAYQVSGVTWGSQTFGFFQWFFEKKETHFFYMIANKRKANRTNPLVSSYMLPVRISFR